MKTRSRKVYPTTIAIAVVLAIVLTFSLVACAKNNAPASESETTVKDKVLILYTSDVHCGVDQGFGYEGLAAVRASYEAQGYATVLVDDGDAVQGEPIGTISQGDAIIDLMNVLRYDVAIPGNHEFDYTVERFLDLADKADFPYISCNFNKQGELLLDPYVIKEAAGIKIGFVGVTTPETLTSSTPSYFKDESGELIYGFMQDQSGQKLYDAVQSAVDGARAEGADYVYLLAHLGNEDALAPWRYSDVIEHTNGIDVLLDGHSHDAEQTVVNNKDGVPVVRSACGTKMANIGYSFVTKEGIGDTNIWTWRNKESAPLLLGLHGEVSDAILDAKTAFDKRLAQVIATSPYDLTINDPTALDESGNPLRIVRRMETNLGDLCADAIRAKAQADIAFINGGGVRVSVNKGDITYGDVLSVLPFGNTVCMIQATGQQILDALEWCSATTPGQFGGFLQTSGLSYEIDISIPTPCLRDESGALADIEGQRRVQNVKVAGVPLDPDKTYTVASSSYILLDAGDGNTAFLGATLLQSSLSLDYQALIDYIQVELSGVIGEQYANPYGQGRIRIVE